MRSWEFNEAVRIMESQIEKQRKAIEAAKGG